MTDKLLTCKCMEDESEYETTVSPISYTLARSMKETMDEHFPELCPVGKIDMIARITGIVLHAYFRFDLDQQGGATLGQVMEIAKSVYTTHEQAEISLHRFCQSRGVDPALSGKKIREMMQGIDEAQGAPRQ